MKFSLIIPAFNEQDSIISLVEECHKVIPADLLGELIVVDDASTDDSSNELVRLKKRYPKLRILKHKQNSGQSASLRTGILAAKYNIIAQLDGDGQNDPADLERLTGALGKPGSNGNALVGGIRASRMDTLSKKLASRLANRIRNAILNDGCPDTGCGTKVYWREAYLQLPFFTSLHRFLPALFQSAGYRCAYLPVNDRPRQSGASKYNNLNRALIGLFDLFGVRWLRKRSANPDTTEL